MITNRFKTLGLSATLTLSMLGAALSIGPAEAATTGHTSGQSPLPNCSDVQTPAHKTDVNACPATPTPKTTSGVDEGVAANDQMAAIFGGAQNGAGGNDGKGFAD